MRKRLVAIVSLVAALCVCATLVGYATGMKAMTKQRGVAFTLRGTLTHYQPDGTIFVEEVTRYESSDGSWREVRRTGEHVSEQFFVQGRGFFTVQHDRRRLLHNTLASMTRDNLARASAAELLQAPQFNRTELLLGRTAYVMQIRDGEIPTAEVYVVPEFGSTPVKYVEFDVTGRVISVQEPTDITPGEPPPSNLKGPNYPVAPTA